MENIQVGDTVHFNEFPSWTARDGVVYDIQDNEIFVEVHGDEAPAVFSFEDSWSACGHYKRDRDLLYIK